MDTQDLFLLYSILFSILTIFSAKELNYSLIALVICPAHTLLTYYFYANSDFPFLHSFFYFYLQTIWFIYAIMSLGYPKLRSFYYNIIFAWTSAWYTSTTCILVFMLPLKLVINKDYHDYFIVITASISIIGIFQTLFAFNFAENVYINLVNRKSYHKITRIPTNIKPANITRNLKIFQITDTHLGSFTSVERLRSLCEKVVLLNPDLVALTGDFCTHESRGDPLCLAKALEPLKSLKGRVICCLGNHDYESQYESIIDGLKANDVIILQDEDIIIETQFGKVQVLGCNYYFSNGKQKIENLFMKLKRNPECELHLTLLHNPSHFKYIQDGDTDMVLSGHNHGGHIGFLSLGINLTILNLFDIFTKSHKEDNGLWGFKTNRVYSHRGTGFYGFPIRIGVSSEESLINLIF